VARRLHIRVEHFALDRPFAIARGTKHEAVVVVATVAADHHSGRGECVPYGRYGETPASVLAQLEALRAAVEDGLGREALQGRLPAGAARNALDCALWDLDSKRLGLRAASLAGLHRMLPVTTAYTLSLGPPDAMARAAADAAWRPLLKVKLGGTDDAVAISAVRDAAPDATLLVDANEGWTPDILEARFDACHRAGVVLIEQPLPAGHDDALARMARPVPVCADESLHTRTGLEALRDRYDAINIKLDKTGGLTEALLLAGEAERLGFGIMVGCMVASSLAVAPALLLAPRARFVDLDGPLLLARDREPGLVYDGSWLLPAEPELWG